MERYFFHSFPRPKVGESEEFTLQRGLSVLSFMKEAGLVLAPEVVSWDVTVISGGAEHLQLLQRRACFTELSVPELAAHSATFGPIALSFDITKLRAAGATPVIYAPQGIAESALSQIGTFCVRGAYHTKYVLHQLQGLKELSDPEIATKRFRMPVDPNYQMNLQNKDAAGNIVADHQVRASDVRHILQHVGFNNIPFDHSVGVLALFLNMFYPTDNTHTGDRLGYYRQREWRLIAGDINFNGRPMGRTLSQIEAAKLQEIDQQFWTRELTVEGVTHQRSALALVYEPQPEWNFFELVDAIYAPQEALDRVRAIVDDTIAVHPYS
jgi:hypothetical protein